MELNGTNELSGLVPAKVSILGEESIVIDHGLWLGYVASDLLQHVKADPKAPTKFALVTDTNLHDLYVPSFLQSFKSVKHSLGSQDEILTYTVPPGESSKSHGTVAAIHDWLAASKCTKDCVVIALGGGVIGDMVGYAAATYMRGVSVVQVPTTLLSMVDSSIGGKTAIDTPYGKNLVGAFWQPKRVYIDLKFLHTLPKREFINGMAEIIKTAAIWNEEEFTALEDNVNKVQEYLNRAETHAPPDEKMTAIIKRMIFGSAKVKAEVVSKDEREGGLRNLLNFGHSIGHAMEGILAPQILHGECVAVGMVKEAELSRYLGILSSEAVARLTKCIASYDLPISLNDKLLRKRSANRECPVDDILTIMAVDKKNQGAQKRIVLLGAIGRTFEPKATAVPDKDIRVILSSAIRVHRGPSTPQMVTCTPPGSKSISNRALVLAALGSGVCRIKNLLHSDDTQVMLDALTKINAAVFSWEDEGQTLVVEGKGGAIKACRSELYLGNAGTASRFLTAVSTLARPAEANSLILTGNERMKERPIGPLVSSLESNGIRIEYKETKGSLPIEVAAAGGMQGGEINLAATISSQYVSAILMCAPYAKTPVTLRLVGGKPISQAYIDMTVAMMAAFGVHVTKSDTQEHTYHIPVQNYINPNEYEIESDASSATYPLAIAAITGTTCTIPNIGAKSLQGDARFATDVLRPMGCDVKQTETSTTVTGPNPGELRPLPTVNMEPMTDAFLTACVLAAVAKPNERGRTTCITGIANQRVKECDRLAAMRTQLAKFGVICREIDDGIEVDGIGLNLKQPSTQISCFDDHRVAMSFSVLALCASNPITVEDKYCVAKTWPAWWDSLSNIFKVSLEGVDATPTHVNGVAHDSEYKKSIFLIGMRGAGKSTAGRWAAPVLGWPLIDLDDELERTTGTTIPDIIREKGWEGFREEETKLLLKVMKEKPHGHIFACGGGVVEMPENRKVLIDYYRKGGLVLLISRSIENIIAYLQIDKTRPSYVDDMYSVWTRRKPWYLECSNFQYYGANFGFLSNGREPAAEAVERVFFFRLILHLTGKASALDLIRRKDRSYFVSLTLPRLEESAQAMIKKVVVGSDAVELRVDLLEDPNPRIPGVPTVEFVTKEYSFLRATVDLPVIFTIRTKSQGGKFPDSAIPEALQLYMMAIRSGIEFIDLEMTWPTAMLEHITSAKANSRIIASHHAPHGLSWKDGSWIPHYNKALQYGDVIKLISFAHSLEDNDDLEGFRRWATKSNSTPLIALNMGPFGQLSRIRNPFMTPVSHPALPFKAAPGQLSARDIRRGLSMIGVIEKYKFFVCGKPVAASRSPALHNTMFHDVGLPHSYGILETDRASDVEEAIQSSDFGGASVTIPLKLDVIPLVDEVESAAAAIGAVNTLVVDRNHPPHDKSSRHHRIIGYNTDWKGIQASLQSAGSFDPYAVKQPSSAVVVGGGGTSRAAIYALHHMGYSYIYLAGRTRSKLEEVAATFPDTYNITVVTSKEDVREALATPVSAVGTIPADQPIDESLRLLVEHIFSLPLLEHQEHIPRKVLLEMAYKPRVTELMEVARMAGWVTVPGLEALTAQGVKQFELWTGIEPLYEAARDAVLGDFR